MPLRKRRSREITSSRAAASSSVAPLPTRKESSEAKVLAKDSRRFCGSCTPTNLSEQKFRFFKYGLTPEFEFSKGKTARDVEARVLRSELNDIRTDLFLQAKAVLDRVRHEYYDGMHLVQDMYGERLAGEEEASEIIKDYMRQHDLLGRIALFWSETMSGSAKMCWKGPPKKQNKPEQRNFSLVVKNSNDNMYLRTHGLSCLMNHEIGTHYIRAFNEGLQPWYSDRKGFGLHLTSERISVASEEGLAAINCIVAARCKFLWGAAMSYYTACMGAQMSFEELFDHLERYTKCKDYRWKLVLRVKRGLSDTERWGGIGHDQVYFEGAAKILMNLDDIDLTAMFYGRVAYDQTLRVRRSARTDCIKIPLFARDIERYRFMLKYIAYVNGLRERPEVPAPERPRLGSNESPHMFERRPSREKKPRKVKEWFQDAPFMFFSDRDVPVELQVPVSFPPCARPKTPQSTVVHRDFIYPTSPLTDNVIVDRLRKLISPAESMLLALDSPINSHTVVPVRSSSDRELYPQGPVLPEITTAYPMERRPTSHEW